MLPTQDFSGRARHHDGEHQPPSESSTRIVETTSATELVRHFQSTTGSQFTDKHRAVCDLGDRYLFLTIDYISPVINDPLLSGKLAASRAVNALFSCGGKPLIANSIRACDARIGDDAYPAIMMRGAQSVMDQFGINIDGGHQGDPQRPLLGFSIVGEVEKDRLRKNNSARNGDLIVMTKPIGLGIFANALKAGLLAEQDICPGILQLIASHNALGRELSAHAGVSSMTDIAELGLIGHLAEMIRPADVDALLCHRRIAYLTGAQKVAAAMTGNAGAIFSNIRRYARHVVYHTELPLEEELLIHDPQPNGGLLFTIDRKTYTAHRQSWSALCPSLCVIGEMVEGNGVIEVH